MDALRTHHNSPDQGFEYLVQVNLQVRAHAPRFASTVAGLDHMILWKDSLDAFVLVIKYSHGHCAAAHCRCLPSFRVKQKIRHETKS